MDRTTAGRESPANSGGLGGLWSTKHISTAKAKKTTTKDSHNISNKTTIVSVNKILPEKKLFCGTILFQIIDAKHKKKICPKI